jgi:alpha-glucosidase (family GH31 glycosyl hydrolase)
LGNNTHYVMRKKPQRVSLTGRENTGITFGKARFTILTDRMVRLEYADDRQFEDRPSLAVMNRISTRIPVQIRKVRNKIVITTKSLVLEYRDSGRGFSKENMKIKFRLNGKWAFWRFGMKDALNLGGTIRTLDNAHGDHVQLWHQNEQGHWSPDRKVPIDLGHGFISRSGWAVHDDSNKIILDPASPAYTAWANSRPDGFRQDLYFLGYGLDYKQALLDASNFFGRQPLPPRYVLGYWYSRYWAYTDREIENMVDQFDRMKLPIDVMVIDMDWHLQGWTGYTWDPDYFPDPTALLRDLRKRGIKITLNLHPADGVGKHEAAFPEFCRDLGLDPAITDRVPFDCTDPKFMSSYFKRLHHPEEKRGVDFWWLDWQQGSKTKIEGLDPLPWLNHLHWQDQRTNRPQQRALNFSRYGGPGSGRYPVGFSGDTQAIWESLAYQPYFTATASNVLYGTWSHDIGGHQPGHIGPELYTRWIQFGIYSPVLRTHTSKNREAERRVWLYPEPYRDIMMENLRERYRMIPYIYSEMRSTVDTAISLLRPMYYEHPTDKSAYTFNHQYYFGSAMIVSPVTKPVDPKTEMADIETWLPPGTWYDTARGCIERGSRIIKRDYLLDEIPVFVKAGAVIPGQGDTTRLHRGSYAHLTVHAYPGGHGHYDCYEDDGISNEYLNGKSATIPMDQRTKGNNRSIEVGPARGTFNGFTKKRSLTIYVHGSAPPRSVTVNGRTARWKFDGDTGTVVIKIITADISRRIRVDVVADSALSRPFRHGWAGLMRRMAKIGAYANLVSPPHPVHPEERLAIRMGQTGNRLTRRPESAQLEMTNFKKLIKRLPTALEEFQKEYLLRNDQGAAAILQKARDILARTNGTFVPTQR